MTRGPRSRSLVSEIETSQRIAIALLALALAVSLLGSLYLLGQTQPRLARTIDMTREARLVYEGMLDREAAVLGWLATGDQDFLRDTATDSSQADAANADADALVGALVAEPEFAPDITAMMVQRQRWLQWSATMLAQAPNEQQRADGTVSRDLVTGREIFDAYRGAQLSATDKIVALRDNALEAQRRAMVTMLVTDGVLLAVAVVLMQVRSRVVARRITTPVRALLSGIDTMRSGRVFTLTRTGLADIDVVAGALATLSAEVRAAQEQSAARETELMSLTAHLHLLLTLSRSVAGSASVHLTAQAVVQVGRELLGGPSTVWIPATGPADPLVEAEDTRSWEAVAVSAGESRYAPTALAAPQAVQLCGAELRPVHRDGATAYPLVVSGMLIAVLHVEGGRLEAGEDAVIDALLSTAAAALASTQVLTSTRHQAETDALTGLANRRRLDADLSLEVRRAERFGRPLSLLMLDLDHFKQINDNHGHAAGDQVLQEVAARITAQLRTTDSAYRFGGEEIAVVLRETTSDQALVIAERLRVAIVADPMAAIGRRASASIGQATWSSDMIAASNLVRCADGALYQAKKTGRDRTVRAEGSRAHLPHHASSGSH